MYCTCFGVAKGTDQAAENPASAYKHQPDSRTHILLYLLTFVILHIVTQGCTVILVHNVVRYDLRVSGVDVHARISACHTQT